MDHNSKSRRIRRSRGRPFPIKDNRSTFQGSRENDKNGALNQQTPLHDRFPAFSRLMVKTAGQAQFRVPLGNLDVQSEHGVRLQTPPQSGAIPPTIRPRSCPPLPASDPEDLGDEPPLIDVGTAIKKRDSRRCLVPPPSMGRSRSHNDVAEDPEAQNTLSGPRPLPIRPNSYGPSSSNLDRDDQHLDDMDILGMLYRGNDEESPTTESGLWHRSSSVPASGRDTTWRAIARHQRMSVVGQARTPSEGTRAETMTDPGNQSTCLDNETQVSTTWDASPSVWTNGWNRGLTHPLSDERVERNESLKKESGTAAGELNSPQSHNMSESPESLRNTLDVPLPLSALDLTAESTTAPHQTPKAASSRAEAELGQTTPSGAQQQLQGGGREEGGKEKEERGGGREGKRPEQQNLSKDEEIAYLKEIIAEKDRKLARLQEVVNSLKHVMRLESEVSHLVDQQGSCPSCSKRSLAQIGQLQLTSPPGNE